MGQWLEFRLRNDDEMPLVELHDHVVAWLDENCRKRSKVRVIGINGEPVKIDLLRKWGPTHSTHLLVMLKSTRDATLFKMFWSDFFWSGVGLNGVLLPLIRRVMPKLIAADICGVQPMTGPTASINTLRVRYQNSQPAPVQSSPTSGKRELMRQLLESTRKALENGSL